MPGRPAVTKRVRGMRSAGLQRKLVAVECFSQHFLAKHVKIGFRRRVRTGGKGLTLFAVDKLMAEARRIAAEYRRTTGKSLGISSEISKHDACRLLDLDANDGASGGHDAVGKGARQGLKIQIKGRAIFDESKSGQRIGQFKLDQSWDRVVLVLMDENFEPFEIYEAERAEIEDALRDKTSESRKKRGAMSVARFKNIAQLAWTREEGAVDDEIWDNQAGN